MGWYTDQTILCLKWLLRLRESDRRMTVHLSCAGRRVSFKTRYNRIGISVEIVLSICNVSLLPSSYESICLSFQA